MYQQFWSRKSDLIQEQGVAYDISISKGKKVEVWVAVCRVGLWISGWGWGRYGDAFSGLNYKR